MANPSPNPTQPPSAAEPRPDANAPRVPNAPAGRDENGKPKSPQAAPEPPGGNPVNPDQSGG